MISAALLHQACQSLVIMGLAMSGARLALCQAHPVCVLWCARCRAVQWSILVVLYAEGGQSMAPQCYWQQLSFQAFLLGAVAGNEAVESPVTAQLMSWLRFGTRGLFSILIQESLACVPAV